MQKIQLMKPWITDAEKQAVADVLDSGWLTEGVKVAEFEEAVARYVGVKHAIAYPNATVGLTHALNVFSRDSPTAIVPAFTHPATAVSAVGAGYKVLFSDVMFLTGCVGPVQLSSFEFDPVSVVIPVSWGGHPLFPQVYRQARDCDWTVIEDAACSLGAVDENGVKTGKLADVTVFSFHPRKIITTGEGGMVVTDNGLVADTLRHLKNFVFSAGLSGTNAKMSDINAAVGIVQIGRIEEIIDSRRRLAAYYNKLLDGCDVQWGGPRLDCSCTYQSYCVYVHEHRDRLIRDLASRGIESQVGTYYVRDLSMCSLSRDSQYGSEFNTSRDLANSLLALPLHHEITEDDQEYVVESVLELLKSYGG